ncbi:Xyloglucan endotransglucosylase/hydrolase protein 2 [Acorus gramineus]|uniref:Xyloglucan endotransglucosylase/hydrolase n=1 Tax=Acorus gramineus TaxID=55184 RepID=A0AAV9B8C9_ACOGR|nr:Xyloglucan endotransglucosylase/hydrolase protein 2 [Acorus gramineus]
MDSFVLCMMWRLLVIALMVFLVSSQSVSYDKNYKITWGGNHAQYFNQGQELRLSIDPSSGAGFASNSYYGSGYFRMRIMVPNRDSSGVVTAYYLSSVKSNGYHDEMDFEFLGNEPGKPYILQTNIFTGDSGNREQRIRLWFDPTTNFHYYGILWNPYQIVFTVDEVPIRVFKNKRNIGINYVTQPLQVQATLWDGHQWATQGGRPVNWGESPFVARFQGFGIAGCPSGDAAIPGVCSSPRYWWNKYKELSLAQQRAYENVRSRFLLYDYCNDRGRTPKPPPECV